LPSHPITALLARAASAREALVDARHETAFRLFNGFLEGFADLAIDLYAATAVLHDYADPPGRGAAAVDAACLFLRAQLPWVNAAVLKARHGTTAAERNGRLVFGSATDRRVREHGVWYAVDLCMNRDASLYLDTRHLREWAIGHLGGKSVLNTFAYTGSLGVAALAGGAVRVVQLDLNRRFLDFAKASCALNGFAVNPRDFLAADFYTTVSRMKSRNERFDCVFLDPPFFAETRRGRIDLESGGARLINKVRPLVRDGGYLVAVNNALFTSGREYMTALETLCADGYLRVEELVPVPADSMGYPGTRIGNPITDPAPFNHATKIAVLSVRRKAP